MKLIDFIILAVVAVIVIAVVLHLRRAKKKGAHCAGCPYGGSCGGNCAGKNENK